MWIHVALYGPYGYGSKLGPPKKTWLCQQGERMLISVYGDLFDVSVSRMDLVIWGTWIIQKHRKMITHSRILLYMFIYYV